MIMEVGASPRVSTSQKRVIYTASAWRIHQFEIQTADKAYKVVSIRLQGSLFLWLGERSSALLNEIGLGIPIMNGEDKCDAVATTLLGCENTATSLARRLSISLKKPVYVSSGVVLDRFILLLIERGLLAEIKNRPEFF